MERRPPFAQFDPLASERLWPVHHVVEEGDANPVRHPRTHDLHRRRREDGCWAGVLRAATTQSFAEIRWVSLQPKRTEPSS